MEVYRDFLQTKGKGKTSRAHADAAADEEGSDPEAGPEEENYEEENYDKENYEEEIEEEEHGDDGDYVEVELEVIPEEDHDGHAADGPAPATETKKMQAVTLTDLKRMAWKMKKNAMRTIRTTTRKRSSSMKSTAERSFGPDWP